MKNKIFLINILNFLLRNPINSISWYKDGIKLQDDSKPRLSNRDLISNKRKKSVTIHTNHANPHKYVSKLKIRVRLFLLLTVN